MAEHHTSISVFASMTTGKGERAEKSQNERIHSGKDVDHFCSYFIRNVGQRPHVTLRGQKSVISKSVISPCSPVQTEGKY